MEDDSEEEQDIDADVEMAPEGQNEDSEDSSDSESEDEGQRGGRDRLQATQGIDIPLGLNIPVVSELARD